MNRERINSLYIDLFCGAGGTSMLYEVYNSNNQIHKP